MKKDEIKNEEITHVLLPKGNEVFGLILSELGGARFVCLCSDKKERICRVPGRLKRDVWVKEGDYVIIKPWDVEGDKKGDIIYRYRPLEVEWLRKKGLLKEL
ncbi:MAG: translation initiation factor eIF-1A [Candidatus Anstonellales archaeon]